MRSARNIAIVALIAVPVAFLPGGGQAAEAAVTATELAFSRPEAVLHVGVAGGRGITPGSLVIGSEAVCADLSAEIPVFVWVGPAGSRAASAGTFLTLAAHVAAMAPGGADRRAHVADEVGRPGSVEDVDLFFF